MVRPLQNVPFMAMLLVLLCLPQTIKPVLTTQVAATSASRSKGPHKVKQTNNSQKNGTTRCYHCQKTFGNCADGMCIGAACIKTVGYHGEASVVGKDCLPGDPAGYTETCADSVEMGVSILFCTCLQDYCNHAQRSHNVPSNKILYIMALVFIASVLIHLDLATDSIGSVQNHKVS